MPQAVGGANDTVARAPRDGYTLMLTAQSAQTINPWRYRNAGFDPVKDFEPVMSVATAPYLLVANPKFPVRDLKGLIDHARTPSCATASSR